MASLIRISSSGPGVRRGSEEQFQIIRNRDSPQRLWISPISSSDTLLLFEVLYMNIMYFDQIYSHPLPLSLSSRTLTLLFPPNLIYSFTNPESTRCYASCARVEAITRTWMGSEGVFCPWACFWHPKGLSILSGSVSSRQMPWVPVATSMMTTETSILVGCSPLPIMLKKTDSPYPVSRQRSIVLQLEVPWTMLAFWLDWFCVGLMLYSHGHHELMSAMVQM